MVDSEVRFSVDFEKNEKVLKIVGNAKNEKRLRRHFTVQKTIHLI